MFIRMGHSDNWNIPIVIRKTPGSEGEPGAGLGLITVVKVFAFTSISPDKTTDESTPSSGNDGILSGINRGMNWAPFHRK